MTTRQTPDAVREAMALLPKLRDLLKPATARPWRVFDGGQGLLAIMKGDRPKIRSSAFDKRWKEIVKWAGFDGTDVGKRYDVANATLIVEAVNTLPILLDAIEHLAALDSRADHDRRIYEQGRRDACEDHDIALDSRAGDAGEGWPVKWSGPVTVGNMIANLLTLPPEMPIHSAYHLIRDGQPSRLFVKHPTVSRERVDGREIKTGDESVPYSAVIWSHGRDPEIAAALVVAEIERIDRMTAAEQTAIEDWSE